MGNTIDTEFKKNSGVNESSNRTVSDDRDLVECQHCHKFTPVAGPRRCSTAPIPQTKVNDLSIPSSEDIQIQIQQSDLHKRVLQACHLTARTSSDSSRFDEIYKMFGYCIGSGSVSNAKALKRLKKHLTNRPDLITWRSCNMETYAKDGFTVLHAACSNQGNMEVVEYLLQEYILKEPSTSDGDEDEEERLDINDTDMQGRTALHLAAYEGNLKIVELLREAYETLEGRGNQEEDNGVEEMTEQLKGLSTNSDNVTFMTPKTPNSVSGKSTRKLMSRSPKVHRSPTQFSGRNAPFDLAKKTPLAYAATSPTPGARRNRNESKKLLYGKGGDRCLDGVEKTPPKERCGGRMLSPMKGRTPPPNVNYLSPTPQKTQRPPLTTDTTYGTPFLSPPSTTTVEDAIEKGLNWGVSEKPGWRIEMEDAMCCHYPLPVPHRPSDYNEDNIPTLGLFGVFDGHGDGGIASKFIATNLLNKLVSHPQWPIAYYSVNSDNNSTTEGDGAMLNLLQESFQGLDDDLKNNPRQIKNGGSTAIVAVVSDGKFFVANVGDSRCILVKKQNGKEEKERDTAAKSNELDFNTLEVIPLSEDHKPNLPSERARIESAGMTIHVDHIPPVEGVAGPTTIHKVKKSDNEVLAVARAFGDFDYKSNENLSPSRQAVICTPEITVRERKFDEDMYLILACDGIWDVMNDEEVGLFVVKRVAELCTNVTKGNTDDVLAQVGDDLLDLCLNKGSEDNMSVMILSLAASGFGGVSGSTGVTLSDGAKKLTF